MTVKLVGEISRRQFLSNSLYGAVGAGLASISSAVDAGAKNAIALGDIYFPPPEDQGGWRRVNPRDVPGINAGKLENAVSFHNQSPVSVSRGAALLIIHKGVVIAESYVTGR
ncbi:MAG TPA: hypothetical protein P5227_08735, partial [Emcibacteraceae bacterium]|nr:hypothetical protein [Emcibacteraceae bacterium]